MKRPIASADACCSPTKKIDAKEAAIAAFKAKRMSNTPSSETSIQRPYFVNLLYRWAGKCDFNSPTRKEPIDSSKPDEPSIG